MAIGVVGSTFGGLLGQALYVHESGDLAGLFLSLLCAALFVTPYHLVACIYVNE